MNAGLLQGDGHAQNSSVKTDFALLLGGKFRESLVAKTGFGGTLKADGPCHAFPFGKIPAGWQGRLQQKCSSGLFPRFLAVKGADAAQAAGDVQDALLFAVAKHFVAIDSAKY